jgi:hypothetical protein
MKMWNRLGSRDRRAILMGALLLGALFGHEYALQPWLASWAQARQTIELAQQHRLDEQTLQLRLEAERGRLKRIYGPGALQPLAPAQQVRISFVKTVEDLVKSAGLASQGVRDLPLRPLRDVPGAVLVGLQIEATGQQQQLAQCLAKMSQAPTLICFDTLNVTADPRRPQQLSVTLVLWTIAMEEPLP